MLLQELEVLGGGRGGVHQDQVRDAVRMAEGVLQRQDSTPGVSQHGDGFQPEILPHSFYIFHIRLHGDIFRLYIPSRLSAPSLVIVDKAISVGQAIQIGE
jgi:hypothetical protein